MKNTLALLRTRLGHGNIKKFIENDLGVPYRTFVHQCSVGAMPYRTIKLLIEKTGISFEDFKDYEYAENHEALNKEDKKVVRKEKQVARTIEEGLRELDLPQAQPLSSIFGNK